MRKIFLLCVVLVLNTSYIIGQSLEDKFNVLIESNETFKEYKVIEKEELQQFWSEVNNEVKSKADEIKQLNDIVIQKSSEIKKLSDSNAAMKKQMDDLSLQQSSISALGIQFDKSTFKIVNIVIISLLAVGIVLLVIRLVEREKIAKTKINDYQHLDEKFEEFRKDSLEKQMKLRRDLQTERNRLMEIKPKARL